ncbi:MAG: hypothetical protein A3H91_03535 [Gammaproteobacteria bacterium RIFCSPLOWO2_02_FULL_61_13]|nr:MAG: hypothetical protein A3H91_03535 [Gammaproteobacteria bacterium RIFCSPLOWO2_02_FULL_61_13]
MQSDSSAVTVVKPDSQVDPSNEVLDSLRTRFVTRGLNRLAALALIFGVVTAIAVVVNIGLRYWAPRHAIQESAASYAFVIALAGLSFLMWWLIDRRKFPDRALTIAGLAYVLLFGFSIALGHAQSLWWLENERMQGTTWLCVWILLQPILLPTTLRQSLVITILLALCAPAAVTLIVIYFDLGMPGFITYFSVTFPNLVAAGVALFTARVMQQLDSEVTRVRSMGSYHLKHKLGQGGMGEVWEATHGLLSHSAAIKLIDPGALLQQDARSKQITERFFQEARAVSSLSSPHTVQLFDFGVSDAGTLYIVMELLDGDDLHWIIKRNGCMPPARAMHILLQICDSLEEAHDRGLLHRDIKPANVFLCRLGVEYDYVKVLDFGIARTMAELNENPAAHAVEGTPAFMAPEALSGTGSVDARSDIYSIGCVALWMLTGTYLPRRQHSVGIRRANSVEEFQPDEKLRAERVPSDLQKVVVSCLEEQPDPRPASISALRENLIACNIGARWTNDDARAWWRDRM